VAHVTDVAAITTILPNVWNIVRTVIATINLKAEVNPEATEAVADAEEEETEEDSTGRIHKQEEEEQEERHQEEGSTTTTGTEASMALAKKMDSMTNTTKNMGVRTIPPASTTSTGNSTRKTIEAAGAGTPADGHVRDVHSLTLRGGQCRGQLL
jgi:hypothetical protein